MEQRVLVLRTGLDGGGTRTEGEAAGSLGIRVIRVQQLERRGLQDLRAAAAFGGCQAQGGQSASFSTGSSLFTTSTVLPGTTFAAQPVDLFAGHFAGPTSATRLDDPAQDVLLLGLAAVILGVGLLLGAWRDRRRRARPRSASLA